jgi:hypothetical protein
MISDFVRDGRLATLPAVGEPPPPPGTAALLASPRLFLYVALQDAHAPLQAPQVRRKRFFCVFLCSTFYMKRSFYQDRLRTNIGRALKKDCFLKGVHRSLPPSL